MRYLMIVTIILAPLLSKAQDNRDLNAVVKAAGVSEDEIKLICDAATAGGSIFEEDWKVTAMEELIYDFEEIRYGEALTNPTKKKEFQQILAQNGKRSIRSVFVSRGVIFMVLQRL